MSVSRTQKQFKVIKNWIKESIKDFKGGSLKFAINDNDTTKIQRVILQAPKQMDELLLSDLKAINGKNMELLLDMGFKLPTTHHIMDDFINNPEILSSLIKKGCSWDIIFEDTFPHKQYRTGPFHSHEKHNTLYNLHCLMIPQPHVSNFFYEPKELEKLVNHFNRGLNKVVDVLLENNFFTSDYYKDSYNFHEATLLSFSKHPKSNFENFKKLEALQENIILEKDLQNKGIENTHSSKNKIL